eukprot:1307311-Pleurochrysis_carterae.AAC.3
MTLRVVQRRGECWRRWVAVMCDLYMCCESPAWPALRLVAGAALALALASSPVATRERRGPVVRVLRVGARSPSLRKGCLRPGRRYGNQRTSQHLDGFRVRSCRSKPPQTASR